MTDAEFLRGYIRGNGDGSVQCYERALSALNRLEQAASQASPAPAGWQAVIQKARDGLAAGSRSKSNTDFEMEYGGALIDSIAEGLELLPAAPAVESVRPPAGAECSWARCIYHGCDGTCTTFKESDG